MFRRHQDLDLKLLEGEELEKALKKRERLRKIKGALPVLISVLATAVIALVYAFVPLSLLLAPYDLPPREEGELRVHFLSIGQGDCTLVEFPAGELLIIDAGDGGFSYRNHLIRYVKGLAPEYITLILTHADSDHYGGMRALLKAFDVENVYLPEYEEDTPEYRGLLSVVERSGASIDTLTRYDVLSDPSGAFLACIAPRSLGETKVDPSAVFYLEFEGVGVMLSGDIDAAEEGRLASEYALMEGIFDCGEHRVRLEETDILKISHHGSGYSSSEEWLSLLSPEAAVVSTGRGNGYDHPSYEALSRVASAGAEIYRTDELGDIVITIDEGGYALSYGEEI